MKGTHELTIQSAHLRYDMQFSRNLTILQGNSATGKTTLVDMIQEYLLNGTDTGIALSCDCPCRVIAGNTWKEQLSLIENSIVFIDEGNRFVASEEFAVTILGSSNYYVIITREALDNLPYSVTEIYGLRSSGKYNSMKPVYHQMYRIYGEETVTSSMDDGSIIVEDSNSGYEFFGSLSENSGRRCVSAGGAGNIFRMLQDCDSREGITVIADGAAFGSQMGRIWQLMQRRSGIRLYLPESFEWLLLSSDILDDTEVRHILENPSEYIESERFMSWERFFTQLLIGKTQGTWLQYAKASLNPAYLQGKSLQRIIGVLPTEVRRLFSV